jgi:hypothetical protein
MVFENKARFQQLDKIDDFIKNQFNIGFEFEFYLNKTNLEIILKELYDLLKVDIVIPFIDNAFIKIEKGEIIKSLGKDIKETKKESDIFNIDNIKTKNYNFKPSNELFILATDISGGYQMFEFITGPLPYNKAIEILKTISNYIAQNGYTRHNSALHINISVNNEKLGLPELKRLNIIKYSLLFNDDLLKKYYKEKYLNYSVKSIKHFLSISEFKYNDIFDQITPDTIKNFLNVFIKNENKVTGSFFEIKKYYQVNFSKLEHNYIEFRGCIGEDYYKKIKENIEIIDYYIQSLYHTLKHNNEFSEIEKQDLKELMEFNNVLLSCIEDYSIFKKYFKNIKFLIDLKENDEFAKVYWQNLKSVLKPIIYSFFDSGLHNEINKQPKTFYFNYDTDISHLQLYGFNIKNLFMEYLTEKRVFIDFVKCNIKNSTLFFSYLKNNTIDNCIITGSNILDGNKIFESKIHKCKYLGISEYTKTNIKNTVKIDNLNKLKNNKTELKELTFKGKLLNDCILITTFIDFKQTKINKSTLVYYYDFDEKEMIKLDQS